MCFRPAEISMKKCPSCGKVCKPVDKTCPDCGTELDNTAKGFDADQPINPQAPNAPGAPKPPSAK